MVAFDRAMMELSSLMASVTLLVLLAEASGMEGRAGGFNTHMSWFGFFFFLRMAVAVSSSSLRSAPEASLYVHG